MDYEKASRRAFRSAASKSGRCSHRSMVDVLSDHDVLPSPLRPTFIDRLFLFSARISCRALSSGSTS